MIEGEIQGIMLKSNARCYDECAFLYSTSNVVCQ